jgi:branched-chain amino acid transport system permease protein
LVVEEIIIYGTVQGAVYALLALGYSLVYGVGGILNLAHGAYYLVAAYAFYLIAEIPIWLQIGVMSVNVSFWLGMVIALIGATIVGVISYYFIIKPLKEFHISMLMGTFAIGFFFEQLAIVTVGPKYYTISTIFTNYLNIQLHYILIIIIVSIIIINLIIIFTKKFKYIKIHYISIFLVSLMGVILLLIFINGPEIVRLQLHWILIILTSSIIVAITIIFINKSKIGKSIRAVSQDREAAMLMGINADRTLMYTIMISAFLAGIAAILYVPMDVIAPFKGWPVLTNAIAVVILGGMGSVSGSVIGAFVIGYARILTDYIFDPVYSSLVPVIIIIVILIFRPQGLFGKKEIS